MDNSTSFEKKEFKWLQAVLWHKPTDQLLNCTWGDFQQKLEDGEVT